MKWKYLSPADIAHVMGVSRRTVARWVEEGRLPAIEKPPEEYAGGKDRFDPLLPELAIKRKKPRLFIREDEFEKWLASDEEALKVIAESRTRNAQRPKGR